MPVLASAKEVTVSLCIRGHSQAGILIEWYEPQGWRTKMILSEPSRVTAKSRSSEQEGAVLRKNISGNDWIHLGYTVWDKPPESIFKLYVNGTLQRAARKNITSVLDVSTEARVGGNPHWGGQ